jgi:hypothetical protein
MIIQANLPLVNVATAPKKVLSKPPTPNDDIVRKQAEKNQATSQSTPNNAERTELFEQIEFIDNSQKIDFRSNDIESQNRASIQSYLDTKAIENQDLRDELHQQLGVDLQA